MNKKMSISSDLTVTALTQGIEDYKREYKSLPTILRCGRISFIEAYEIKSKGIMEALAIIYGLADLVNGLRIIYDNTFQDYIWSLETEPNSLYNEGA